MEKNKNKKKLFAIIAASALAFVLTVALSVSITLAYFGDTANGTRALTMGGSVMVENLSTDTTDLVGVIPGMKVDMKLSTKVKSSTTQDAYLVAVVNVTAKDSSDQDITNDTIKNELLSLVKAGAGWVEAGTATEKSGSGVSGKVYLYGTGDSATTIPADTTGIDVNFVSGTATIPTGWDNSYADLKLTVTITYVAVQTPVGSDGAKVKSVDMDALKNVVESVGKFTFTAKA